MDDETRHPAATRLRTARALAHYATAKQFAETHGIKTSTYANHEAGSRGIECAVAELYAKLLGVRAAWLAWGEEPMKAAAAADQPESDEAVPLAERVSDLHRAINELLSMKRPEDGYTAVVPLARQLADVIERAGFSQEPSKSEPRSASNS